MSFLKFLTVLASASNLVTAYNIQSGFNAPPIVENRTIDEIYQAALQEGGSVTLWHGGDEKTQRDSLKKAFEARFPGITLNVTVDLSKYLDVGIDQQLASNDVFVDTVMLQTLHDYPRWKAEGALLSYKPLGFEEIYDPFKDADAAYTGMYVIAWANIWNANYVANGSTPKEYTDYLKPEFKDKLVLTYPNDDDAVLYQFDLILKQYGVAWFDALLAQNPRWVRGTATPSKLVRTSNGTYTATFTSSIGTKASAPLGLSYPTEGTFTSWPQFGAILKDAPHPETAKLLHNWILSLEGQTATAIWSVRKDQPAPAGFSKILDQVGTDPTKFAAFMGDRAAVESLRFFFEKKIGTAQGLSPLEDDL